MTPRTEVRGIKRPVSSRSRPVGCGIARLLMAQASAWGVDASPHHSTPGYASHPTRPAARSLSDGGGTPPLAGVGVFVRVHDARKAVLAHADDVSWFEVYDVNRHLMPIDLDSSLVY